ncbi:A-factor receptor protein [Pandoraea terrae]|uniref:A-factor receptor protein n=1 Tax=Pandoraea terrae TaxID=1537710 RepID=A0A5E4XZR0_9BURK|nr:TetR/AcrR family transcriptional regulator [Pandoraea terrae]VVE41874.1 A-factor receptor protein [Pandoraea terrae]
MKSSIVKGEARERILLAAEELIAKHGVDGVSARSINAAAGVSAGILHYHFGTLENVLNALLERHMAPLMSERLVMYDALLSMPEVTARGVVELLTLPLARKVIEQGEAGARYVRFMARLNSDRAPETRRIFAESFGEGGARLIEVLHSALPAIPKEILRPRLIFCSHAMVHSLAELASTALPSILPDHHQRQQYLWSQVEVLIEFLCGGLAAPTHIAVPSSLS